jgi:sodium-dependent phosphate cotransporter
LSQRPAIRRYHYVQRIVFGIAGILVFILALWLLKKGASGLEPVMSHLQVSGIANTLGLGWLMAYLVLSGSPVATIALTLFGSNLLSGVETFAMITGSRLGASFIVLVVGLIYWLRGKQRGSSVSIGILSLLVTSTVYLPAMALGYVILSGHWFDGLQVGQAGQMTSLLETIYDPIVNLLADRLHLPNAVIFVLGIGTLLAAFKAFDQALPEIDPHSSHFNRIAELVYRPVFMVLLGAGITCITLSVSVSLSLLVPLAVKGYVRRENVIPYIMGANVTTFIDTLLAALLISTPPGQPSAFLIVLTEMLSVAVISLMALTLSFSLYQRTVERALELILHNNRTLAIFVGAILVIPIILLLL